MTDQILERASDLISAIERADYRSGQDVLRRVTAFVRSTPELSAIVAKWPLPATDPLQRLIDSPVSERMPVTGDPVELGRVWCFVQAIADGDENTFFLAMHRYGDAGRGPFETFSHEAVIPMVEAMLRPLFRNSQEVAKRQAKRSSYKHEIWRASLALAVGLMVGRCSAPSPCVTAAAPLNTPATSRTCVPPSSPPFSQLTPTAYHPCEFSGNDAASEQR